MRALILISFKILLMSALCVTAQLSSASRALAELVTLELKGVKVPHTKVSGATWDVKVPFRPGSALPDLFIEVKSGASVLLKTPVTRDALTARYQGQTVRYKRGAPIRILVWDKDLGKSDLIGAISISGRVGELRLSRDRVRELWVTITELHQETPHVHQDDSSHSTTYRRSEGQLAELRPQRAKETTTSRAELTPTRQVSPTSLYLPLGSSRNPSLDSSLDSSLSPSHGESAQSQRSVGSSRIAHMAHRAEGSTMGQLVNQAVSQPRDQVVDRPEARSEAELTPLSHAELDVIPTQVKALGRAQSQMIAQTTPTPETRPKSHATSSTTETHPTPTSPQGIAQGRSCDQRVDCLLHGLCSERDSERDSERASERASERNHRCAVLKDQDCQGSMPCIIHGRCTAQSGACIATQGRDCLASRDCRDHDHCSISHGRCVKLN